MGGRYVGLNNVEARLSTAVVRRICDDDNDGTADSNAIDELIESSESRVEGACRDIYDLTALRAASPGEIKRLVLDGIVAYAAMRFPKAMSRPWEPLMESWRKDLKALRAGEYGLDIVGPPEPAANKGGEILTGSVEDGAEPLDPTFLGGFGDF